MALQYIMNIAYDNQVNILLIQEPSIRSLERRLTRFHSGYEIHTLVDTWADDRPKTPQRLVAFPWVEVSTFGTLHGSLNRLPRVSADASVFINWTGTADLALILRAGEPNYRNGNVLDLAWASGKL